MCASTARLTAGFYVLFVLNEFALVLSFVYFVMDIQMTKLVYLHWEETGMYEA